MEILQDEGSGGGLMFGGFGNDIALAEEISMASKISAEARLQGFKSLNLIFWIAGILFVIYLLIQLLGHLGLLTS